ncbi:G-protein alpha subunit family protein [Aspergillus tubingensis]|uniref:G-protein alpha subunit family protein n=1 Tax=Aspergillus tubingensis TaxID=5068 RepID=UPI00157863ED|nr:G-protein alpha subunit family protein [Aspergillus tubingensis]GFN18831.1 G-protein alpha subunit family protein [Aspergillus tubingensis]
MDRLPPELHVKIGRYLWIDELYQLVLVSKFCYSTFTPELYREFQLQGVYRLWEPDFHMDEDGPPARCLPYAIIENPDLAGFVRSLQLVPFIYPGSPKIELSRVLQETGRGDFLHSHPLTRQMILRWHNELESDPKLDSCQSLRNPWFALLLLQLKYLQDLYVFLPCDEHGHGQKGPAPTPHFDEVISWAANPESGILTRLTHLTLEESQARFDYKPPGISVIRLIPFLEISSLRHIRVTRIADQNEQALPRKFNSKVTHLDVKQCDKTFTQLPQLLMGCSELESFTWTLEESTHHLFRRPHRPGFHWEPNRAYDAIYQLRSTLRHLSIKSHVCRGDLYLHHDVEYPQPAYFGSLCDFPVLETLQMRMVNLLPFQPGTRVPTSPLWKILPSSLRFLSIDGCLMQTSNMLCDELEDLAAHCQTHLPQLEKVHIAYSHYEKINGQQCLACEGPGSVMSYKKVKADPAIVARLRALGVKFNKQGVRLRPFGKFKDGKYVDDANRWWY